jgi:hypothetical protein
MTNPQQDKAVHFAAIEAASRAVQALSEHWSVVDLTVERVDYLGSVCRLNIEKDDPEEEDDDDDTRSFSK